MGRSYTPVYRIEFQDCGGAKVRQAWRGKATRAALESWIWAYHDSMKTGGCNDHVPQTLGYVPTVTQAKIVRQRDHALMVEWTMPMFMVI